MKKAQNLYKIIMAIFITIIITLLIVAGVVYNYFKENADNNYIGTVDKATVKVDTSSIDSAISGIRTIIDSVYLKDVDESSVIDGAIKGYVEGLNDPYTEYMTKEEWAKYKQENLGNYTGLGVYLSGLEEGIKIEFVIKGSPAEKSGMQVGDVILKIDDIVCNKDTLEQATEHIKSGEIGTKFTVEYKRGEELKTEEFVRENIRLIQISSELLENNVGYMYLPTFDDGCAQDFINNYLELKQSGAESLIIDLRNNTGGVLSDALTIVQTMLPKDKIMLVTNSKSAGYTEYKSQTDEVFDIPVVVLVNEYTASASEILAAALQENDRATIVGTKTYGKGVLQEVILLNNGESALKITTHEFFTPNRHTINEIGITPNIELAIPEKYTNISQVPKEEDNQLEKAIEILTEKN